MCVHHVVDLVSGPITFGLQRAVFSVTDYSIQNKCQNRVWQLSICMRVGSAFNRKCK